MVLMVSGEPIPIVLQGYAVTGTELKTKNQIYSVMVVYGLLTYENRMVSIPNKELMDKFHELLLINDSLGYVYNLAKESERMLAATLAGDTDTVWSGRIRQARGVRTKKAFFSQLTGSGIHRKESIKILHLQIIGARYRNYYD